VVPEETPRVSVVGGAALRVQTGELEPDVLDRVKVALADAYDVDPSAVTTTSVGPSWGADVTGKALRGLVIFLLLVALVMTVYFRAWRMAVAALVSLAFDLVITVGAYAAVGWEVSPASMIGFLTILSYSIYDTVVVFDKVRENTEEVLEQKRYTYAELVNLAVNQTLVRSLNTSIVALLPVSAILFIGAFLLGAGTLRDIALSLFVGMAVGTVLSVYFAAPLQVTLREQEPAIAAHTAKVLAARAEAVAAGDATVDEAGRPLVRVGVQVPGSHLGTAAQPRRRKPNRPAGRRS
jgi:preprotein translocase subunit SecF